jgi:phospholipid/cholesterol/gamma-HCH transport system substrate-binding protein
VPYHRMKFAVGVFVIVLILLFALLIYVILQKKGVFEERVSYNFTTRSAESLSIGMPIRYSGFEIGYIDHIELTEQGAVRVFIDINKEHAKWIRSGTLLRLEKPLIGSPTIDVITTLDTPMLPAESSLQMVVQDDINDIINKIEPVVQDLQNIVRSVNAITAELASEKGALRTTLDNLERYTDQMVRDDALLTTLSGDPAATEHLKRTLTELDAMSAELHRNLVTPSADTLQRIDAILDDISNKLQTLDGTVKAVGAYDSELIELKSDIRNGIEKTTRLIDKVDGMLGNDTPSEAPLP